MVRHKTLVNSTNRGFGDLGDERAPRGTAHAVEDRLIDMLEECLTGPNLSLRSVNIRHFREFLRTLGAKAGFDAETIGLCLSDDLACETMIHYTVAGLKRMQHRQEYSINWLLQHGWPVECIPDGQSYLGV